MWSRRLRLFQGEWGWGFGGIDGVVVGGCDECANGLVLYDAGDLAVNLVDVTLDRGGQCFVNFVLDLWMGFRAGHRCGISWRRERSIGILME